MTLSILMFIGLRWEKPHTFGPLEWIDVPESWISAFFHTLDSRPQDPGCQHEHIPRGQQMYVVVCESTYQKVNLKYFSFCFEDY